MSEEEKAIKWLENNTKNYKLKSEELHYILVLFNLIANLQEKNQKYKEVIEKVINKLETDIEFCKNDSQNVYDLCNIAIAREKKILNILKEVEHE